MHGTHVGVFDPGRCLRLPQKPLRQFRIRRQAETRDFQRHVPLQQRVVSAVNPTHASLAQQRIDLVAAKGLADLQRRSVDGITAVRSRRGSWGIALRLPRRSAHGFARAALLHVLQVDSTRNTGKSPVQFRRFRQLTDHRPCQTLRLQQFENHLVLAAQLRPFVQVLLREFAIRRFPAVLLVDFDQFQENASAKRMILAR